VTPDDPRHGTNAGYIAHTVARVPPCDPCRAASAAYQRERDKRLYFSPRGTLRVPSLGYLRRIQALVALGYAMQDLDRELGYKAGSVSRFLKESPPWVLEARAKKIGALYERLCMTPAPEGFARTRALSVAGRNKWLPPLAWDDIDTDPTPEPEAKPHGRPMVRHIQIEDAEWLADMGENLTGVCARLGIKPDSLRNACVRAGRLDVYHRLADREPDREMRAAVRASKRVA
jgi:hypothetical protein